MPDLDRWERFYVDRSKPCPFFTTRPDECLAGWITEGNIPPGRALDIGCGNGRNAIFLAKHGFEVDANDLSATAIAWAGERATQSGARLNLLRGSILASELDAGAFSLIYDSGCFHHVAPDERDRYVDIVCRALAPGGAFGLVCFTPEGGSGYSDEEACAKGSLGGGLGYTEDRLRSIWGGRLRISTLRRMVHQDPPSDLFGVDFLWSMLAYRDHRSDA